MALQILAVLYSRCDARAKNVTAFLWPAEPPLSVTLLLILRKNRSALSTDIKNLIFTDLDTVRQGDWLGEGDEPPQSRASKTS